VNACECHAGPSGHYHFCQLQIDRGSV